MHLFCTICVQFIKLSYAMYSTFKHDLRTVLCKNLKSIAQDCNVQSRNLNKGIESLPQIPIF